jgi:outer membrane lipoprotein SlyB
MPFKRPARGPMWIAGVSICVLAASGVVAIVRAIPASYASIPDERASSKQGGFPSAFEDAQADLPQARPAETRDTINRRNRVRCRDCGVVESIRQIERSIDASRPDTVAVKIAGGAVGGASGSAGAARALTQSDYAITVRFRDGSTTVINEANARTWQLGSRVIVIGRSRASNN